MIGWWKDLVSTRASEWLFTPLSAGDENAVGPESAYLSVFISSMHIVKVRRGLSRFYGAVSSYGALPHRRGGLAEFVVVSTPAKLKDVTPGDLGRLLTLNTRLLGPVPYRGGDVQLQVGLFSIRSADLAGPYLELLEVMTTAAGVSLIGPATAMVTPIRRGLELLVGTGGPAALEIGLSTTLAPPRTGTYCLMGTDAGAVDVAQLRLGTNARLLLGDQPVSDVPYLVLSVESSPTRDDWFQIPDLRQAHQDLVTEVERGDLRRVEGALAVFRRAAVLSPDLLAHDGARLADRVGDDVKLALGARATALATATIRPLEAVDLYGAGPET